VRKGDYLKMRERVYCTMDQREMALLNHFALDDMRGRSSALRKLALEALYAHYDASDRLANYMVEYDERAAKGWV
jgi:hypothetical protein